MKKNKLRAILDALSPDGTSADFKEFDKSVETLKASLRENIQAKTLGDVNRRLDTFQKKIDFKPIKESLKKVEQNFNERWKSATDALHEELREYTRMVESSAAKVDLDRAAGDISATRAAIDALAKQREVDLAEASQRLAEVNKFATDTLRGLRALSDEVSEIEVPTDYATQKELADAIEKMDQMERSLRTRISSLPVGGGNANRNIQIGGVDVLTKYTDLNIKAGSGIDLTYSNNDTTKALDLTITSTGSVAGTTRSINRIATSQGASSVAGTDFVYICTDGIQVTLPDATGLTNLYTVKNIAASSVLVSTTGGQTIDGDSNVILATQFTAVDLVNDGNNNWSIT